MIHPLTEQFIIKSNIVHKNKYLYSKSFYISAKTKLIISCKVHGDFEQTPNDHLSGYGCFMCAKNTTNVFETFCAFFKKHGNRYDYSKSIYKNAKSKLEIICNIHGPFFQTSSNHLLNDGCPKCSSLYFDTTSFIDVCRSKNNYNYDYSSTIFISPKQKVNIVCLEHGLFSILPYNHYKGQGCKECGKLKTIKAKQDDLISFTLKANTKHNYYFNYDKVKYKSSIETIKIGCPIHGYFEQTPVNHLRGHGCIQCVHEKNQSKLEEKIINQLKIMIPDIEIRTSYRPKWLHKKELDIFLPHYNIAIEVNGSAFHHSSLGVSLFYDNTYKEIDYHLNKYLKCQEYNINLYHYFEFEPLDVFMEKIYQMLSDNSKYKITYTNNKRNYKNLIYYGQSDVVLTKLH